MMFSLSTRWNAGRHTRGEEMIQEALGLGFRAVELGYDLRADLVPGVLSMIRNGSVRVTSLHNFCPLPVGAPRAHPELFTFTDPDSRVRDSAVNHTLNTIRFARETGASVVVAHAGYVDMERLTGPLCGLIEQGQQYSPLYEKIKLKLQAQRDKRAPKALSYLHKSLERLLPELEKAGVILGLENLPTWESVPSEVEMEELMRRFHSPWIRHWNDLGHGRVRENLGFISQERWMERLQPHTVGMHIHDVRAPARDHLMPPRGQMDFARLKRFATPDTIKVIEPPPGIPAEEIAEALAFLTRVWAEDAPGTPMSGP